MISDHSAVWRALNYRSLAGPTPCEVPIRTPTKFEVPTRTPTKCRQGHPRSTDKDTHSYRQGHPQYRQGHPRTARRLVWAGRGVIKRACRRFRDSKTAEDKPQLGKDTLGGGLLGGLSRTPETNCVEHSVQYKIRCQVFLYKRCIVFILQGAGVDAVQQMLPTPPPDECAHVRRRLRRDVWLRRLRIGRRGRKTRPVP